MQHFVSNPTAHSIVLDTDTLPGVPGHDEMFMRPNPLHGARSASYCQSAIALSGTKVILFPAGEGLRHICVHAVLE
jgi:hypothetical protein